MCSESNHLYQKKSLHFLLFLWGLLLMAVLFFPGRSFGIIYIDINAPSARKFNIAIPDFMNQSIHNEHPELSSGLPAVIKNDLDLSGYFKSMDKAAFLVEKGASASANIRFKDWSVIGAELLLRGNYTCIGSSLEVEIRLYDVFWGRQILGKRAIGSINDPGSIIHRLGNEIIRTLTGQDGIFCSKLAFVGNASGHKEIYVCDYDGHNVQPLTADKSIALLPKWSPNGNKIIYTSYKDGGPMLFLKDMASGVLKRISARSGLNIGSSWTPDGKKVALTLSQKGNPDIFIIDLNGKIVKNMIHHWGIDVSPAFSPNGKKIAFVSNRSGSPQIYVYGLGRETEERLTFEGNYNTSPVWSRLNRLAFVSTNNGHFDICTMDSDGTNLIKLTEDQGNNEDPCWSPDGRYIVFSSNRAGNYHLYIMNANGQNQRRITFLKGDQTSPSWSW